MASPTATVPLAGLASVAEAEVDKLPPKQRCYLSISLGVGGALVAFLGVVGTVSPTLAALAASFSASMGLVAKEACAGLLGGKA